MKFDYYPFGMMMPGRKYAAESGYRYGFNGKENDNDVKGEGNSLDFGARIYDPRIGRWHSTDHVVKPWLSPYQFSSNNPTNLSDPDGGDEIHFHYITITRNVSLIRHDATGKAFVETRSMSHTYTYLQIIQDNNQDRFFVHRQGKGEPQDIEFYPNVNGGFTKSGVTTSSWYLWKDTKDRDFVSLLKMADDFPELKGQVLPAEISNPNSSGGQHGENRKFWQSFFSIKASHEIQEREESQRREFVVGVLVAAVSELAIARLASFISKGEIYYRALSKADYESFLTTGNIPATGETFISGSKAFASDYKGVLLEINAKSGTLKQLEGLGVRNAAAGHPNSGLPLVKSGWSKENAFFKLETNPSGLKTVNIGLGQGKALQTFNNNIQSVKVLRNP